MFESPYAPQGALAEAFGQLAGEPQSYPPRLTHAGRAFTGEYAPGEDASGSYLTVRALAGTNPGANPVALEGGAQSYRASAASAFPKEKLWPLTVRIETQTDRWGKRLGLNREAQLGLADYDARYYLETQMEPALVRAALLAPDVLATIDKLFAMGVDELVLYDGAALATARFDAPDRALFTAQGLRPALDTLAALAALLPHDAPSPRGRRAVRTAALTVAATLVGIAVAGACVMRLATLEPVPMSTYVAGTALGLLLAAGLALLLARVVRGRANSLRMMALAAPFLLVLAPLFVTAVIASHRGPDETQRPPPMRRSARP